MLLENSRKDASELIEVPKVLLMLILNSEIDTISQCIQAGNWSE